MRFEVSTIDRRMRRPIVPSSGIVTRPRRAARAGTPRSRRRHGRSRRSAALPAGGRDARAREQWPADQVLRAEQVLLARARSPRLGEADREQLARVVPLVERLGSVDPLVALQADQRGVEHLRQRLRGLGLADAGLALEQQRLGKAERRGNRGRVSPRRRDSRPPRARSASVSSTSWARVRLILAFRGATRRGADIAGARRGRDRRRYPAPGCTACSTRIDRGLRRSSVRSRHRRLPRRTDVRRDSLDALRAERMVGHGVTRRRTRSPDIRCGRDQIVDERRRPGSCPAIEGDHLISAIRPPARPPWLRRRRSSG